MSHICRTRDDDKRFVIDPVTRDIQHPSNEIYLVQNDNDSERFTFEIPLIIEGHNMSECNLIEVYYVNTKSSNKQKHYGFYRVRDMLADYISLPPEPDFTTGGTETPIEGTATFSWVVSSDSLMHAGDLDFAITLSCVGDEGVIKYAWSTAWCKIIKVLPGPPKDYEGEQVLATRVLNEIELLIDESGVIEYAANV